MTTPVFCCGFECGAVDTGAHCTFFGTASVDTGTVRSGSRAGRCNPTATTGSFAASNTLSASNKAVLRIYVWFTTLPNAITPLLTGQNSGAGLRHGAYFNSSDSKIYAGSGTSALGASGVSVTTGQWYRIDVKLDASNNPHTIDVQVDGSLCGQATVAAAAANYATAEFKAGFVGTNVTADVFFDDWLISQTTGDYPLGPGFVNHFIPTSDGTHNIAGTGDFQRGNTGTDILNATTTAFQLIDDIPLPSGTVDEADNIRAVAPPNSTDYPECVFGPASGISTPTAGPRAVEVILAYHQIATQTGQMVVELRDNATTNTIFDTGSAAGVTSYRHTHKHYATAPSTGGAWGVSAGNANFNNLRVRFRAPDAAPDQCLDAIMIEAEFAEAGSDLTKTFSDDLNNYADARGLGYGNLHADSVNNLADVLVLTLGIPLSFSDNANNLTDSEAHVLGVTTVGADSLQDLTDALVKLLSYELALADTTAANWADAHQLLLAYFLALADSYTLSDTTTVVLGEREIFTDSLTVLSDATVVGLGYSTPLADLLATLTDAYSQLVEQLKIFTDSLPALTDSLQLGHGLAFVDALAISDAIDLQLDQRLQFADNIALSDSEQHELGELVSVADDANNLADVVALQLGYLVSGNDALANYADYATACLYVLGLEIECVDSDARIGLEFYDALTLTDDYSQQLHEITNALELDLSDALNLSDSLALGYGLFTADVISLSDAQATELGQLVSFSDSLALSDFALINEAHLFGLDDSFILTDSQSLTLGYNALFTDSIGLLADAESDQLGQLVQVTDDLDLLADTYQQILGQLLSLSESILLNDSTTLILHHLVSGADDINLLVDLLEIDSPQAPEILVGVTDALNALSDSIQLRLGYQATLSDDANILSDSVTLELGYRASLSDSLTLTDTASSTLDHLVPLVDQFTLTDAIQLRLGYELNVVDVVVLSDSYTSNLNYLISLSDNAALLTDSVLETLGFSLILNDNTSNLTDSIELFVAWFLRLSDTLALNDSLAKSGQGFLPLADSFALSDEVALELRGPDLDESLADSFTLTDAISLTLGNELQYQIVLIDTISLSDHYFDLRHPYTPSAKRHIVVPSRARVTRVTGSRKVTVPASNRTTKAE